MSDFAGKVVVVTGGSGNLGQAVVRAFDTAGASIVILDRSADRVRALMSDVAAVDRHYIVDKADVTNAETVTSIVSSVLDRYGRIDILVNTVGGYRAGDPVHETSLETWDFMMNVNAKSVFMMSRAVIPAMIQQGRGSIINTSARTAIQAKGKDSAYSASKSAVARITESMAVEYKDHEITVNAILPGIIDTPQNREAMPNADCTHWLSTEAVARVVLFLASDAGKVISGALIPLGR